MNFRQLDLNLLRVLEAIHRSGSVTAAGRELALSQPATSNALARLRAAFDDALFVRSPTGLHPTRLAQRIVPAVRAHLQGLETALAHEERFDPGRARVHWRLSLSDLGEILFLPPLAAALRERAPGCVLENVAVSAADVSAALESRTVDLAIGILAPTHRGVVSEPLFDEHYVAIASSRWQPAGRAGRNIGGAVGTSKEAPLTAAQLAAAPLATASPTATFHENVPRMLASVGLAQRVVVQARHYAALPELVATTDVVAIVPRAFARSLGRRHGIRSWELPGPGAPYEVRMVWHESATQDGAHAWLRELVRERIGGGALADESNAANQRSSAPKRRRTAAR